MRNVQAVLWCVLVQILYTTFRFATSPAKPVLHMGLLCSQSHASAAVHKGISCGDHDALFSPNNFGSIAGCVQQLVGVTHMLELLCKERDIHPLLTSFNVPSPPYPEISCADQITVHVFYMLGYRPWQGVGVSHVWAWRTRSTRQGKI